MKNTYFRLFACCIPVRGARRSTICDLQRHSYHLIPNDLFDILTIYKDLSMEDIRARFLKEDQETLSEYFSFLLEKDLGFLCEDPATFPDIDLTWEIPDRISNAIIDSDINSHHNFASIFCQLDELGCRALQLRFFCEISPSEMDQVLSPTLGGRLRSIQLILKYSEEWTESSLEALCRRHARVLSVCVHSSPKEYLVQLKSGTVPAWYSQQLIESERNCGEVHPAYFVTNISCFSEATRYNSCLNRKLSVDCRGEIRNCPAMPRSFGNIRSTSLHGAVIQRDFQEVWTVNKDQIETCKDCEFRYICTDCRAILRDPGDQFSKPSKCTYNPYIAQWEGKPGLDEEDGMAK